MSYLLDLDEYTMEQLTGEVNRRLKLQEKALCDYCNRPGITPSCKFPERHAQAGPRDIIPFPKSRT